MKHYMVCAAMLTMLAVAASAQDSGSATPAITEAQPAAAPAPAAAPSMSEADKLSYVIGMQIGKSFKSQEFEANISVLVKGIEDVQAGREPVIPESEVKEIMMAHQRKVMAKLQEKKRIEGEANAAKGKEFLAQNKANEGVVELPSGLQYKVLTEGTGKTPVSDSRVKVNYRGTLLDGTEFDSSYKRNTPAEFAVNGVIKGWTEALLLMKEGAKWQLFIPSDLAYGERGTGNIPPNSVLTFEVELLEVMAQ